MGIDQSTLEPASDPAREIATLWWVLFGVSAVVVAVVTMLVLLAVVRARSRQAPIPGEPADAKWLIVAGGALVPGVVLVVLFALTVGAMPATSASKGPAALELEIVGKQWFWEVRYPERGVVTANEIHIPARTPVLFEVRTDDVIHSLWVPRLHRKLDLIPGKENSFVIEADAPGRYRGQCAEFCGLQHAHMAFLVVAHEPGEFEDWLDAQARPARENALFLEKGCGACHRIAGTEARGEVGPDLTHLASREALAGLTLPNTRGDLAAWIVDPQHFKPGAKMPGTRFTGDELDALLDYLESLE